MKSTLSSVSPSVMKKIKSGDVGMRPRLYFVAASMASLVGIVLSGLVVSYFLSIVFFWVRIQTADTMAFGARANLSQSLDSFPWWAVPLALVAFLITVRLVRQRGTLYRLRVSTVAAALIIIVILLGIGMSYLGIGGHSDTGRRGAAQGQHGQGWRNHAQ